MNFKAHQTPSACLQQCGPTKVVRASARRGGAASGNWSDAHQSISFVSLQNVYRYFDITNHEWSQAPTSVSGPALSLQYA